MTTQYYIYTTDQGTFIGNYVYNIHTNFWVETLEAICEDRCNKSSATFICLITKKQAMALTNHKILK